MQKPFTQIKSLIPAMPAIPQIPLPLKGTVQAGEGTFGNVLGDLLSKVNKTMNRAEELTEASVVTGKVNLHEVMIAMAEEEVALGLTTQVAGKFISTVEKLTQMQV